MIPVGLPIVIVLACVGIAGQMIAAISSGWDEL
jgi:hypothetical protein